MMDEKSTDVVRHDSGSDVEKHHVYPAEIDGIKAGQSDPDDPGHSLHRGLSARQITMIAIGGAIGM